MEHCKLIIIAAVSVDGVIGVDNDIPWKISEDFRHFRNTTMGNMLLVGYNTFKTLPPKAFEGREYIVLNTSVPITDLGADIYQFSDLDIILPQLYNINCDVEKVFIAGGAMVYDTMIDLCEECIITWVDIKVPNGNKRFPIDKLFANFEVKSDQDWQTSKSGLQYKVTYYTKK